MANVFRLLLFPFSFLWGWVAGFRNWLFDIQVFEAKSFPLPIVCVGNLEMGGTGKTPMIDLLISHFHQNHQIVCLSRGYGRKSKGMVWADENAGPEEIGDEAHLIYQKWKGKIRLLVEVDRVKGVEHILNKHPETSLILMDDGMQHRWVKPKVILQLSPFQKPFYENYLFPFGQLRETKAGAKRAKFHIFTKSPALNEETLNHFKKSMVQENLPDKQVFISSTSYQEPKNREGKTLAHTEKVVAIAGLADNRPFFEKVKSDFLTERCLSKPDHYRYLPDFFEKEGLLGKHILCTEKDFYKLLSLAPEPNLVFYLPISCQVFPEVLFWNALEKELLD